MDNEDFFNAIERILRGDARANDHSPLPAWANDHSPLPSLPLKTQRITSLTPDELEQNSVLMARSKILEDACRTHSRQCESLQADITAFWMKLRLRLGAMADEGSVHIDESGDVYITK